jgi:hypothetical protein
MGRRDEDEELEGNIEQETEKGIFVLSYLILRQSISP